MEICVYLKLQNNLSFFTDKFTNRLNCVILIQKNTVL